MPDLIHLPLLAAVSANSGESVSLAFLILTVLVAVAFDFTNGFPDTANAVATSISTRVLSPRIAIVMAAFLNFLGAFVSTQVAKTIGTDVAQPSALTPIVVMAALLAAIVWNLLTWYLGLPTSSSHALIGGLVGSAVALTGSFDSLIWGGLSWILLFIVLAPVIGAFLGAAIMIAVMWTFRRFSPQRVDRIFRRGQLLSAALFSLGHG